MYRRRPYRAYLPVRYTRPWERLIPKYWTNALFFRNETGCLAKANRANIHSRHMDQPLGLFCGDRFCVRLGKSEVSLYGLAGWVT